MPKKNIQTLRLDQIRLDGNTQTRVARNESVEEEYAERMKAGDIFPPLIVFFDGEEYWLVDGFQRVAAAARAEITELPCEIREGTLEEAQWECLRSNATHGLRRSREDIAQAIELAFLHSYAKSDGHIADHVGVSRSTVTRHRAKLVSTGALHQLDERLGKDGKMRQLPQREKNGGHDRPIDPTESTDSDTGGDHIFDSDLPPLNPGETYEALGENDTFAEIVPSPSSDSFWFVRVLVGDWELLTMRGTRAERIQFHLAHFDFRRTGPWLSGPAPAELPDWVPSEKERWAREYHNQQFYFKHGRFPDWRVEEECLSSWVWPPEELLREREELLRKRSEETAPA